MPNQGNRDAGQGPDTRQADPTVWTGGEAEAQVARGKTAILGDAGRAQELSEVLKALGHATRLKLVTLLSDGPSTVGDLAKALGLQQSIVSQHLRILRLSGLVAAERGGGYTHYRLLEPGLRGLIACLVGCKARARAVPDGEPEVPERSSGP